MQTSDTETCPFPQAPEILGASYGKEADVWAVGVCTFLILSGAQPFKGASNEETFTNIVDGKFSFKDEPWDNISANAKDFITKLLTWDESSRPTAVEALKHPWIVNNAKSESVKSLKVTTPAKEKTENERFHWRSKLKLAFCSFIASQLLSKAELKKVDGAFRTIDRNNDGALTKDEAKVAYGKVFDRGITDAEIDDLFETVVCQGVGAVGYADFVMGVLLKKDLLGSNHLQKAFSLFDQEGSGYMNTTDLRALLKFDSSLTDEVISGIVAQVDEEGDGEVMIEEFINAALVSEHREKSPNRKDAEYPDPNLDLPELSVSLKFSAKQFVSHRLGALTDHYEVIDYIAKGRPQLSWSYCYLRCRF